MAEDDSENGASLQLEAKEALLPRPDTIAEVVCGQNGLLAWACFSTLLVFVFGITLVRQVLSYARRRQLPKGKSETSAVA